MTKSKGILPPRRFWAEDEIATLKSRYPRERTEDLAAVLGRPVKSVYAKANELGLNKSSEFLASPASGRTTGRQGGATRFPKGHQPWNKGSHFVAGGRSAETRFTKGQQPHNTQPIGSYRMDKDGTLQRKISNDKGSNSKRWRGVHELVWIAANGPVPPKHIVVFKPGMRTNVLEEITADKVECISFAENMKRNTRHNLPKEVNQVIQLRAVLTRHINKRSKNHERIEQENH
jgi:hypothetical protein